MDEIIAVSGFLVGCPLCLRGMYLFYANRNEVKSVFGIEISGKLIKAWVLFFGAILLLFISLTYINIIFDKVAVTRSGNFYALLTGFVTHLSTAVLEEFFFRLLLFCSLVEFVKSKTLILVIVSVLFSVFHFPETTLTFSSYFLGGLMYGYAYLKFKNILVAVAIHFSWNFIQGTVFGYPVTGTRSDGVFELSIIPNLFFNGGDQGPEASMMGILVRILIVIIIYLYPYSSTNEKFLRLSNTRP